MKISEIRRTIESLNWARNDLNGATLDEFRKMNVPHRLLPHIAAVSALVIPARFAKDIANRQHAIGGNLQQCLPQNNFVPHLVITVPSNYVEEVKLAAYHIFNACDSWEVKEKQ